MQPFKARQQLQLLQQSHQQQQAHSNARMHLPSQPAAQFNAAQHDPPQQQLLLKPTDVLAPAGGLPLSVAAGLNQRVLFMAALSDFAYVKDFGTNLSRQDCGPCLRSWGAQGQPVVIDSTDAAGGVSHCTVFRTDYDLFLLFR
jgi:hypothetical protein